MARLARRVRGAREAALPKLGVARALVVELAQGRHGGHEGLARGRAVVDEALIEELQVVGLP